MLVFQSLQSGGCDVVFERRPGFLAHRSSERPLCSHLPICHSISCTWVRRIDLSLLYLSFCKSMRRPIRVKTIEWSFPDFFVFPFTKPPLSPPFHPHSQLSDFSLGASWVFSIQSFRACGPRKLMKITRGKIATARSGEIEPTLAKSRL